MFKFEREVYVGYNQTTGAFMSLDLNEKPVEVFDTCGTIVRDGDPGDVEFFGCEDSAQYWTEQFPQYKPVKVRVIIEQMED